MSTQIIDDQKPEPPLVDLPLAVVIVGEMGAVSATFDGIDVPPPIDIEHWNRARFGQLLDALTVERSRSIRLEVRESDGSVFTEIIHAKRRSTEPEIEPESAPAWPTPRARRGAPPRLIEISGRGFIPGEDITVALTISSAESNATGLARAAIDLNQLTSGATEILMIGRRSGHIITERPP